MRKFIVPVTLSLNFIFLTISQAGLGSVFQKLLKPVVSVSEQVIGQAVAQSVKLQYGVFDSDPAATEWVNAVFAKMVGVSERKDIRYKITILKPDFVNAFATPGGHIFVTRGLLQRVRSDDELAGVLGHEIGHIVAQHSMNSIKHQLAYQYIIKKLGKNSNNLETMAQIYSLFAQLRYSRKNELESDYIGARYLEAAGYNPQGMVRFLEVLKSLEGHDPSRIEVSLRSHPPSSRRIERIGSYVAGLSEASRVREMTLSYDFLAKHPMKKGKEVSKSQPVTSTTTPEVVFFQGFEKKSSSPGIAEGLKKTQDTGIFVLDSESKKSGIYSQKISTYGQDKTLALGTSPISVAPSTVYRLKGFLKASDIKVTEDPMGSGGFINIQELSTRSFLKGHYGIARQVGTTDGFIEVSYEFETRSDTKFIMLEWVLSKARGAIWFDDFELLKPPGSL